MTRRVEGEGGLQETRWVGWGWGAQGFLFPALRWMKKKKKKTAHAQTELMELYHKSFANYRQGSFQGGTSELIGRTSHLARPGKHISPYHYYSIMIIIHSSAVSDNRKLLTVAARGNIYCA